MKIEESIEALEKELEYQFHDRMLLKQALTHSSFSNEQKINRYPDYERLEFLGDAVLELVTSEFLYNRNSQMQEGKMSKMRASIVCEQALAYCARQIKLGDYILLGRGEESTGGKERNSILSDVFEAIIGAIYVDGGFEKAKKHINKFVLEDSNERILFYDSKSVLQEIVQANGHSSVHYDLLSEEGPEHEKVFRVAVFIDNKKMAEACGHNKKEAEQQAAYQVISQMRKQQEQ